MRHPSILVAASCLALLPGCRARNTVHELDFSWGRMQIQPRYDSYRDGPFFADDIAMRTPPAGTQPYGTAPRNEAVLEGTVAGRDVTTIPVPVTLAVIERGRANFEITCAACHGIAGDGKSVPARFMARKPPSLAEARARQLTDGNIYRFIRDGYGLMPPYATHLDVTDRWAVVAYVRALQRSRHAVVARLPDDVASALARSAP